MFGGCPGIPPSNLNPTDMAKAKRRSKAKKNRAVNATLNPAAHPDAAGIDIGAEELVAAVPPGRCENITATAHKIARILYGMIASGKPYDENEAFKLTPSSKARRILNLQKQAQAFGLQLVPAA